METLFNGYTLEIPKGAFPLSTDSMVLAHFVRLPKNARVLDLGSGCGTLGILLCARDSRCTVTGVELTERSHQAALENISRNALQTRMESICADLAEIPKMISPGSFPCCVSNPPYYTGCPTSSKTPLARQGNGCTPEVLLQSAAWALKYGGDFFLVHKPERLGEILGLAPKFHLEAKRLALVRHRADSGVDLILLQLRKGAKPGLIWEDLILYDENGTPTREYREIYHIL